MAASATSEQYGTPTGNLYDPGVANTERTGVEAARKVLGKIVDRIRATGVHVIVGKHGSDAVAIVPMDWYSDAREALGDPTDL